MEPFNKLIVYESKQLLTVSGQLITTIDYLENYIYLGCKSGNILRFKTVTDRNTSQVKATQTPEKVAIFDSAIETIKCIPMINQVLVQSGSQLMALSHLSNVSHISSNLVNKKCAKFALNHDRKRLGQIIVISKERTPDVKFYMFDQGSSSFKQFYYFTTDIELPFIPRQISFYDKAVSFAFKGEYHFMHFFRDKQEKNQTSIVPICKKPQKPLISIIRENQFLILTENSIGICVDINGRPEQQSAFEFQNQPILDAISHKDYFIVLFDSLIQVFNLSTSKFLQEISSNVQMANCLSKNGSHLFYSDRSNVYHLALTPYESQIQQLLALGKYEEAFLVFNQNIPKDDFQRESKLAQLNIDAGFYFLRLLNFPKSREHFQKVHFDIREIIMLFPNYIPKQKMSFEKVVQSLTILDIIKRRQQTIFYGKPEEQKEQQETGFKKARSEFLLKLLFEKRAFLLQDYEVMKNQKAVFLSSKASVYQDKFKPISVMELVELIDYVIIALYVGFNQVFRLNEFFDKKVYISNLSDEIHDLLCKRWKTKPVMAKFFRQVGNIHKAVLQWKELAQQKDTKVSKEACRETVKLLNVLNDKKIIFDSLNWLFKKEQSDYIHVFDNISKDVILPEEMLEFLDKIQHKKQCIKLKQLYLQSLINNNSESIQDKYYTKLGLLYIQDIFDLKPKLSEIGYDNHPKKKEIQRLIYALDTFLRKPNQRYQSSTLLDKIQKSWLLPQEIFLYGKEKKHKEALQKLIENVEFKMAEEYCTSKDDNLLTDLFQIYVDSYDKEKEEYEKNHDPEHKKLRDDFKQRINEFLKKYPRHSQLDTMRTIELIPDNFMLSQKDGENNVFRFLHSVISHQLHEKRVYQCTKQISEMNKLHIDSKLTLAQKAHVKITHDKKCVYCDKKIGDTVFAVYPNGVVARHTCVGNRNQHVCPLTGQNFLKTFKFD